MEGRTYYVEEMRVGKNNAEVVHERKEGRTTKGVACMIYNRLYVHTNSPSFDRRGRTQKRREGGCCCCCSSRGIVAPPFPRSVDGEEGVAGGLLLFLRRNTPHNILVGGGEEGNV